MADEELADDGPRLMVVEEIGTLPPAMSDVRGVRDLRDPGVGRPLPPTEAREEGRDPELVIGPPCLFSEETEEAVSAVLRGVVGGMGRLRVDS